MDGKAFVGNDGYGSESGPAMNQHCRRRTCAAFTLTEVLAVLVLLGIVAALGLSRIVGGGEAANRRACEVNRSTIELQAQLWYRDRGSWPAADLSDLGGDADYFPAGLPTCPVDGASYTLDPTTHKVLGHAHE